MAQFRALRAVGDQQDHPSLRHIQASPVQPPASFIRSRGRRLTRQRALIWDTLVWHRGRHVSAADVADSVRAQAPELHRATIYRTLDLLVADGLLLRTDLGDNRRYYELPAEHKHHHVVCVCCGRVEHVHNEAIGEMIAEQIEAKSGFRLTDDELTFPARCPACFASEEPPADRR